MTTSLGAIVSGIGTVFTGSIGWVATVSSTIAEDPLLLFGCVALPCVGLGIGLFRRLWNL